MEKQRSGIKKSLKGLCQVYYDNEGEIEVKSGCSFEEEEQGLLRVIYEDGKFYNQVTFNEVRERFINNIK